MRILGIHDGHNASAVLIEDGKILFAIQEERLAYEKNKSGFPAQSVALILKTFFLTPAMIDKVAMASIHTSPEFASGDYFKNYAKSQFTRYVKHTAKKTPLYFLYKLKRRKDRLQSLLNLGFQKEQIEFVEHHLCHAATAYFGSHFPRQEKVLVLTNDGAGDGLCATVSIGEQGNLKRIAEVPSSESLAAIYCMITKMLGFTPLEHEYKLMGMAPYSSANAAQKGAEMFWDLIRISPSDPLLFERGTKLPISLLMPLLQERSEYVRFDAICAGLQKFTEDILVQWVKGCIRQTGIRKVAVAGGIFMNVKANKRIMELPEVEDLFVFPSCGDETVSIGAAYAVHTQIPENRVPIAPLAHFYLGDDFTDEETLNVLQSWQGSCKFKYKPLKNIEKKIASLLAEGRVVARCKGKMEFGARALGNRSILADPSDLRCLREINLMVKKRDFWMPFAPVMLPERAHDYIINPKNIPAPYMILSFDTTARHSDLIAAVHQADLTARPQVIEKAMNPEYYTILKEFEKMTKRGALLNTSFNLHGFPIVRGPREAMDVFEHSDLQYLALGNYLLEKVDF